MAAYYNENDEAAAQWLKNLIAADLIAPGDVDTRSIVDVKADDLKRYTQCHFFAGIGGWSRALRLAGYHDDRPVWTGSCPCQPFSVAGKGEGKADERHLWPAWFNLIRECKPAKVFGEQVEAAIRHGWLDLVYSDLEGIGYAVGAVVIPAAGVGAPHIRQRLWFVGHADGTGRTPRVGEPVGVEARPAKLADTGALSGLADAGSQRRQQKSGSAPCDETAHGRARRVGGEPHGDNLAAGYGENGALANAHGGNPGAEREQPGGQQRLEPQNGRARKLAEPDGGQCRGRADVQGRHDGGGPHTGRQENSGDATEHGGASELADAQARGFGIDGGAPRETGHADERGATVAGSELGNAERAGLEGYPGHGDDSSRRAQPVGSTATPGELSYWSDCDWLPCRDGKARPVEPGTFPLAYGVPGRVVKLRAYGNAIVPQVAAAFILASER